MRTATPSPTGLKRSSSIAGSDRGYAGLTYHTFEASFTPAFEIGYRLAKQSWGQGYATEAAAREAVRYGFEHVGLAEVVSMTAVRNIGSQAVMNKLGMTHHPGGRLRPPPGAQRASCAATRPVPAHGRALAQCGSVKHPGSRHVCALAPLSGALLSRPPDGAQPRAPDVTQMRVTLETRRSGVGAGLAAAHARGRRRLSWDGDASHDGVVDVELLVIPQCPGAHEASELLRRALDDIGLAETPFAVRIVDTEEMARARRFAGSPAFVMDGVDLFESGTAGGSMACRLYPTPDGPRNVPTLRDLRRVLKEQAARAT